MKIDRDKFIEMVETLHAQNLSGREDFRESFKAGIEAAFEEYEKLKVCEDCGRNKVFDDQSWCNQCNDEMKDSLRDETECDHPYAFVMSKCNGEYNKCLNCGLVF